MRIYSTKIISFFLCSSAVLNPSRGYYAYEILSVDFGFSWISYYNLQVKITKMTFLLNTINNLSTVLRILCFFFLLFAVERFKNMHETIKKV